MQERAIDVKIKVSPHVKTNILDSISTKYKHDLIGPVGYSLHFHKINNIFYTLTITYNPNMLRFL